MNETAMNALKNLRAAKDLVERLEKEYRSVCECNEKLSGVSSQEAMKSYNKIHKTCNYHTYRTMHHASV